MSSRRGQHPVKARKRAKAGSARGKPRRTAGGSDGRRLRSAFAALSDGVIVFGADGSVRDLNPAAERILGVPRASALGRRSSPSLWRCFREDGSAIGEDEYPCALTLASGQPQRLVLQLKRRDGTSSWLSITTGLLIEESGATAGVVMSFSDITERRRADAALRASEELQREVIDSTAEQLAQAQKLEAIAQLTGGLAHDYNNMLGIIIGSLDLLAPGVSGENRQLIDAASAAAQRGVEVTRSLLGVARRQKLTPKETNVDELLLELAPLLRQTAGKRVKVAVEARTPGAIVHLDAGGFNNAILNLVINARDAMPSGGEISIATSAVALEAGSVPAGLNPGRHTRVTVTDTGAGMSAGVAARAFDPFYTTKGRGEGTGLGLTTVASFARQCGGLAIIHTTPGSGTTVELLLPCAAPSAAGACAAATRAPSALPRGNERILLVDDETDLLRVNRAALQALGYEVISECAPGEALERLKAERYDMLLSDVVMPGGLDGIALADAARGLHPGLPVLLVSGYADSLIARSPGRYRLLDKPFRQDELARTVREVLDRPDAPALR